MKYIVYIFLLFPILVTAQTYKYIGIENGLSNRRIFNIQKDDQGYMWFLTNEGMDRYNGKDIKHYKLNKDDNSVASQIHLGWLYATPEAGLWVIGRKGRLFQYEKQYDRFTIGYKLPDISKTISYGYVDHNNNIWLCCNDSIVLYNIKNAHTFQFPNILHSNITAIEQIDDNHFFIATETGVRYAKLENGALQIIPTETLDYFHTQVSVLYFQQQQKKLYIGSFERGIFVYDMLSQEIIRPEADLSDVNITRIRPLNETELLVATEGMGVYKLDMNKCILERYISANYQSYNEMNGDNINDVFVDESKRIWLANYPTGITVIDYRYENYHWMKHSMGNKQSIVNDQVHAVIEDSDGDLWFGTSNGISLYNSGTGEWHSFLSSFNHQLKDKNHIFITLCEVSPGIIWAGGYTSGIYKINKADLSVEYFSPYLLSHINMRPDKYIRDMIKDSKGHIWSGGYYNLKCFDLATNSVRLYPGVSSITAIAEKDSHNMWIGTAMGLYLLNRDSGKYEYIKLEAGSTYINTLYQADNGLLYVGTNGAGVFIYDAQNKKFEHYIAKNSALVSNSIFTILPEVDGRIMMSTENGVTSFHTKEKIFHNWTKGEGLLPAYFNASSGVLRKNKNFVFGSTDGAIELPQNVKFPDYVYTKMIFSDLNISYQPVYPGEEDSPLEKSINDTDVLELKYNQNTFSFRVSTINYDSPGNALYAWKLDGFFEKWTEPGTANLIRYTNLPPGKYTLYVRAISREEHDIVFEERTMRIVVTHPFWSSWWAITCYVLLVILGFIFILRVMNVWFDKEKMDSILKNILSNSLKYTPENGKVSVSVSESNDSWKVIIEDTGIGIPSSEQSKLFKLHFRASNAINSKVTGSGIGLMLVGKLVRLHGGKINVESIEHQGTTVRIVFPKSNKHFQNAGLIPPAKPLEQTPELTVPNISATPVNTVETTNSQRILIVEDNDELRSYLVSSLSSMYHVQACGNGREALIIAKEFWPDLILSDIMMPEMRGDELCVAIKNDIETSHIPVLLLTALGDENNILDGMSIGADAYIVKPFNVRILKASIANLLANRALLRSRYANLDIDSEPMIPSANGTTSLDWQFISAVKKSIEENMDNTGFSVDVLCELHHMSRTSFYCKLKALTGQSPTDLIRITRLKRATQLLKEGGHTIAEISDMTGFSESKYFREVFKKHYKMSPTKYAKEGSNSSPIITEDNLSDD